jgi:hypothetical protein
VGPHAPRGGLGLPKIVRRTSQRIALPSWITIAVRHQARTVTSEPSERLRTAAQDSENSAIDRRSFAEARPAIRRPASSPSPMARAAPGAPGEQARKVERVRGGDVRPGPDGRVRRYAACSRGRSNASRGRGGNCPARPDGTRIRSSAEGGSGARPAHPQSTRRRSPRGRVSGGPRPHPASQPTRRRRRPPLRRDGRRGRARRIRT